MYWSAHTHSRYSAKDAIPNVAAMVERAVDLDMPALGLTDHGTIAGIHELYRYSTRAGIMPVPGVEMYVALNRHVETPVTKHMCVLATTTTGWQNLISLANFSQESFRYKPLVDINDLIMFSRKGMLEGLSVTTGCFFGVLNAALMVGKEPAYNVLATLQQIFAGRVYVEVQNHHIVDNTHDDEQLIRLMTSVADELGAPMVVTNDAHYLLRSQQQMHNLLKFISPIGDKVEDGLFPGNGYWLCSGREMQSRFDEQTWDRGLAGLDQLLSDYDLQVPELDTFTARVPKVSARNSDQELRKRVATELEQRQLGREYVERAGSELEVIMSKGFSDYLLLVAQICDWMRESGITYNARGSAAGSLVVWLLGISRPDPIKRGLLFERFLSIDRIKPPDIDLDVEHERRSEVVDKMFERWPCARIVEWGRLKMPDNEAEDEEDQKGSLWVKWKMACEKKHVDPNRADMNLMHQLSDQQTYAGTSIHPAGVVIYPDPAEAARVPMHWIASSATMVTALDMHNIEEAGLIKLDLLGVRTLTAMANTLRIIGMDAEDIPLNDKAVYRRMSSGLTQGIFQLQGYTASSGCKKFKPRTYDDVVHAMALFRKATMQSGATDRFIMQRNTPVKARKRTLHHEIIERHTSSTYGEMIYQEQVLGILRDMGMSAMELSKVLKAVKASNANTSNAAEYMAGTQKLVRTLAHQCGMTELDIEWLFVALAAYAEYGFNRSHAESYAWISYVTAWLLVHHPGLYWSQMMTQYAHDTQKLLSYRESARVVDKMKFSTAHVNYSGLGYKLVGDDIIVDALTKIHGIGTAVAVEIEAHAPYKSIWDIADRCNHRIVTGSLAVLKGHTMDAVGGKLKTLYEAGALDTLPLNHNVPEENE